MANKIGIVLALDGEQKFTQGMRSAQASAKTLKTELSALDKETQGSANTMATLTKKQEALKKAQEGYQRVLTAAKTGQANARKQYQEQQKALDRLSKEYDEAKKALDAMEKEGQQGTDAYKQQAAEVEKLSRAVDQQTTNYLRAETRLASWDTKVAQATSDVKQNDDALQKNAKYMEEASQSADGCAKSIDKMGDEVDGTSKELDEGSKSLKDFLMYTAGNLAADALKAVGDKALEAAKYVIEVGSQFEASMSKVQALSGASAEEFAAMEETAKQLGATTMFSASEVADGFSYMALAGWDAQQSIDAMPGILDLAAASGMDLAEASDMVTDYLSAFGMEAKDATKMADMMAYAQANSNTSTQQLGDAFGNCAANMHAAGQDMKTTTAVLEAFANQGVKGSEAGTKLSAIMRDITAKMKDGKIQIGDTAVAVTDADGNFRDLTDILADVEAATDGMGNAERAAALSTTFTSRSVGGLNMIFTEGVDKIKGYKDQLSYCDGAASDMAKTMQDNLQGKLKEFDSAVEGLGIALYGYFSGPLQSVVEFATKLISGITQALTPQRTELETFVDKVNSEVEAVQAMLDAADQTVADGQRKADEIGAVGEEIEKILNACEQFNLITLDDGRTAVKNANGDIIGSFREVDGKVVETDGVLSDFAKEGMSVEELLQSALTAQNAIGAISEEAVTVESRLKSFAQDGISTDGVESGKEAIVQIFNEAGEQVAEFKSKVSASGDVDIDSSKIQSGTKTIITYFDGVTNSVQSVEAKVDEFGNVTVPSDQINEGTKVIVGYFDDAGNKIGEFQSTVGKSGNVDIPTDGLGIEQGTQAIITCFDNASQSVMSFESEVGKLADGSINLNSLSDGWTAVEDSVRTTYTITDAYTKLKMDKYVEMMGTSVNGLSEAWDSATGTLTANKEELSKWFDTAKQIAIGTSLEKAIQQTAEASASAFIARMDAQSALSESYRQLNQLLKDAGVELGHEVSSYEEASAAVAEHGKELDAYALSVDDNIDSGEELVKNIADMEGAVKSATEAEAEADAELENRRGQLEQYQDVLNGATEATNQAGQAAEGTGDAMGDMGDEAEEAAEQISKYSVDAAKLAKEAYKDASQTIKDAVNDAKEAAKSAFSINPFEAWTANTEHSMQTFAEAMAGQIASMQNYATNLQTVSQHVGQEITPEFLQYLQDMGEDGAQLLQDMADELEKGDPSGKVRDAVEKFTEAMNAQDQIANIMSMNALAYKLGIKEFGSTDAEWNEIGISLERSIEGTNETMESELYSLINTARALGVQIPDGLSEAIEQSDADPEQAISDMISILSNAIRGQQDAIIEAAREAGVEIPTELVSGLASGGEEAVQAWQQIVALISGSEIDTSGFEAQGQKGGDAFVEGTESKTGEAEAAAEAVGNAAKEAIGSAAEKFSSAGTIAGVSFRTGLTNYGGQINSAANARATEAASAAGSHSGEFTSAGSSMGSAFKSGIESIDTTSAGSGLANQAVSGAQSVDAYTAGYGVGSNIGSGINAGLDAWASVIATKASNMVSNAVQAAKNAAEIRSPSRVFRDQVGKMIGAGLALGIEQSTGLVTDAATAQMNQTLYALQKWISDNAGEIAKTGTTLTDAASYSWLSLGRQQAGIGFGISKTKESNGEKTKKTAEEYAREVYRAAQQYMKNVEILYDVSDEEAEKYWTNVRNHLSTGTQAWFDATEQIKRARENQAETARKAAEAEAEAEAERIAKEEEARQKELEKLARHDADLLDQAETYLDHKKILNDVSANWELAYWNKILARMEKGSDEWYQVTKKIKDLQADQTEATQKAMEEQAEAAAEAYTKILTDAEEYVSKQKSLNKMSITQEIAYWVEIRRQLRRGTEEYDKASERIREARAQFGGMGVAESLYDTYTTYYDMSARAEMQYWMYVRRSLKAGTAERIQADKKYLQARKNYYDSMQALDTNYQEDRAELIQSKEEQIAKLREDLASKVADIEKRRDENIANSQQKLADKLKSINEQLVKDIANVNDKLQSDIASTRQQYYDAVEARRNELMNAFDLFDAFESRSASGRDLLFNLQSQAAGYADWQKAIQQLQKRGILSDELMSELIAKGVESSAAIHALNSLSNSELRAYQTAYDQKAAIAQAQAVKDNAQLLKDTKQAIADLRATAKSEIQTLREQAKAERKAAKDETKAEIKAFRSEASTEIKDLKSTTRTEIRTLRQTTADKLVELRNTYKSERKTLSQAINSDIAALAKNIRGIASDQTSALASAFTATANRIAGASTSTGKNVSNSVINAVGLKKKNASGIRSVSDLFAWMDENGIGSEAIVRQDGARLNTNVRPGDAIIPAVSTQNLWDWSKLNPTEMIAGLRAQQAAMNARALQMGSGGMVGSNGMADMMSGIFQLMSKYMPYIAEQKTISVDGRELAGATVGYMSEELAMRSRRQRI